MTKVMRKEARHTQRRDQASGVPLEILGPDTHAAAPGAGAPELLALFSVPPVSSVHHLHTQEGRGVQCIQAIVPSGTFLVCLFSAAGGVLLQN